MVIIKHWLNIVTPVSHVAYVPFLYAYTLSVCGKSNLSWFTKTPCYTLYTNPCFLTLAADSVGFWCQSEFFCQVCWWLYSYHQVRFWRGPWGNQTLVCWKWLPYWIRNKGIYYIPCVHLVKYIFTEFKPEKKSRMYKLYNKKYVKK